MKKWGLLLIDSYSYQLIQYVEEGIGILYEYEKRGEGFGDPERISRLVKIEKYYPSLD